MARIVLTTFGSAGDLNPLLALGVALRGRGHDLLFAVEDNFQPRLHLEGFATHRLTGDSEAALRPYARQVFASSNPLASLQALMGKYILPTLPAKIDELRVACQGADLLVAAASQMAAPFVADLTAIPWASVIITPATLPSAYISPQPLPIQLPEGLRTLSNRLSWALGGAALRRIVDRPINTLRASYGLGPRRDLLWLGGLSPRLAALAVSSAFLPRQPDWPASIEVTGFCQWDTPANWEGSPDATTVENFLSAGGQVIAVTAGSISPGMEDFFTPFYHGAFDAIRQAGARALLIGAPAGVASSIGMADNAHCLQFAPFSHVFPHCAAVIHHGGIGTVAQCLQAGVPALVIPGGLDQSFNAAQTAQIGVGAWLARSRFTAARASSLLKRLLDQPAYRQRTQAIRERIMRENGAETLCDRLESMLMEKSA